MILLLNYGPYIECLILFYSCLLFEIFQWHISEKLTLTSYSANLHIKELFSCVYLKFLTAKIPLGIFKTSLIWSDIFLWKASAVLKWLFVVPRNILQQSDQIVFVHSSSKTSFVISKSKWIQLESKRSIEVSLMSEDN